MLGGTLESAAEALEEADVNLAESAKKAMAVSGLGPSYCASSNSRAYSLWVLRYSSWAAQMSSLYAA
jgi:hypothetical protein